MYIFVVRWRRENREKRNYKEEINKNSKYTVTKKKRVASKKGTFYRIESNLQVLEL